MEVKGAERRAAEETRRYVALRGFFLRLADDVFRLHQDSAEQSESRPTPLPEAVLSLPLQSVRDAVLGLLPAPHHPAASGARQSQSELPPPSTRQTQAKPTPRRAQTQPRRAHQTQTGPPPRSARQTQTTPSRRAQQTRTESTALRPHQTLTQPLPTLTPETRLSSPGGAEAAKGVLAILGGESAERCGRVELVESLEPLRTSVCDQPLPTYSVRVGSVAVADPNVPRSALLLSTFKRKVALRATFGAAEKRVETRPVTELGWDKRFASVAAVFNGRVYVTGGIMDRRSLSEVFVLQGAGKAEEVAAMRTARWHHALLAFGDELVAVGGLSAAKEPLASVEALRPGEAGAQWRALPDLPRPLHSPGAAVFKVRLFVAGGADGGGVFASVHSLGPGGEGWEAEGQLNWSRRSVCLAVFDGRLCALGGVCGFRGSDESWARRVEVFEERERRWRLLPGQLRLPVHRSLALHLA